MSRNIVPRIQSEVHRALGCGERVVLAVSGGVDSMALLDAAADVARDKIVVATFDHRTGPEATMAANLVSLRCKDLGIQCVRGIASVAAQTEAELRAVRWRFLNEVAAALEAHVATAHTADDQIETVLMRTLRDAGARGLAGLAATSRVLRPL